jgi:hypothetical protein
MSALDNIIVLCPEDINQRNFVAFLVRANEIMQGYVLARLLHAAKMHKYFILDTTSRERSQFRPFSRLEAFNRFNQTERANRDQIL